MKWLLNLWYARLRRIDLEVLWPICFDKASDLESAKMAFAFHAMNDKAWMVLGEDEVVRRIDGLTGGE